MATISSGNEQRRKVGEGHLYLCRLGIVKIRLAACLSRLSCGSLWVVGLLAVILFRAVLFD
jgi:hypothetical protein